MIQVSKAHDGFTIHLSDSSADDLADFIEEMEDRYLGQMPKILADIEQALLRADDRVIQVIPNTPNDVEQLLADEGGLNEHNLTDAELASMEAWEESQQAEVAYSSAKRWIALCKERAPQRKIALTRWLNQEAESFQQRKSAWHREFDLSLRREFES